MNDQAAVDADVLGALKEVMEDQFGVLIQTYLDDAQVRIDEMSAAITAADADGLRCGAHSFKGSCSNLGVLPLAEICQKLETMGREGSTDGAAELFDEVRTEFARVTAVLSAEL